MNEKFLHITPGLNEPYPSPDIPEDLAWDEMRKLLDEEDKNLSAPPPFITQPNGNSNWKYGLLLLFIIGLYCYVNWDKLRQVYNKTQSENVNYKKENNRNKTRERNFRVNDSINNPANNNHAAPAISSQPSNNAVPVVVESDSVRLSTKTARIVGVHSSTPISNSMETIFNNSKKITENSIDTTAENKSAGNKGNQKQDTIQSKSSDSIKNQPAKSNNTNKRRTVAPDSPQEDKVGKRFALAAGLGLNQFFTLGSQQHSSYNSGGTVGAISDYIPVPFIRWYINKKLYLQLEGQINTPQYTKQLLAKHEIINDTSRPGQITENNSVYINKLFYFNIPLSINYSLSQNFYVGAGLQFSQLTNGVGLFEGQEYSPLRPDTLSNSKIASIKEDPVYKEIKTIEWRILLDVNYQWQNLVMGVRYNQALSNFINVRISSTQVTQARNNSIQLYLRYILWKNKKTKELLTR